MGDNDNVAPGSRRDPDTGDSREDFENRSQENAEEGSDSQTAWEVNRKRTYDVYQSFDVEAFRQNQRLVEDAARQAARLTESTARQAQQELSAINNVTIQALQNAVATTHKISTDAANDVASTRAQTLRHFDVATDALWTDELNPEMRGAAATIAAQGAVNPSLASTASLDVAFTNISAQNGQLVAGYVTMAQALAQSNATIAAANAELIALLKGKTAA